MRRQKGLGSQLEMKRRLCRHLFFATKLFLSGITDMGLCLLPLCLGRLR